MNIGEIIRNSVGNNLKNDKDDVLSVKRELAKQGDFDQQNGVEPHGYMTRELDTGIKRFQRRENLRVDGRLFPNGETEKALLKKNKLSINSNALNSNDQNTSKEPNPTPNPAGKSNEKEDNKDGADPCSDLEIAYINAEAELYIARQSLSSAQKKLQEYQGSYNELSDSLDLLNEKILKENKDAAISSAKGKAAGGSIGALTGAMVGARAGSAGAFSLGTIGMSVGGTVGKLVQEVHDVLSSDDQTDIQLNMSKQKILSEMKTIKGLMDQQRQLIDEEVRPVVSAKADARQITKGHYDACKKSKK